MPDSRPESGPAHPGKVRATPGLRVHGHDGGTRDVGRAVIRDPGAGAGAQASWRLTPAGAGAHRQLPAWQRVAWRSLGSQEGPFVRYLFLAGCRYPGGHGLCFDTDMLLSCLVWSRNALSTEWQWERAVPQSLAVCLIPFWGGQRVCCAGCTPLLFLGFSRSLTVCPA